MRLLAALVIKHRARRAVLNALRFAERLRKHDSEFAPSYAQTIEGIGDELALLAREICRTEAERRALLDGLFSAFESMYDGNLALAQRITLRLSPRVLNQGLRHPMRQASLQIAV
jgi:hypothetical protein